MRGRERKSKLATQLWPFIQRRVSNLAAPSGSGGTSCYAPSPHDLASAHHSGTLDPTQFPTGLLCDGSRALTGNLGVAAGVTIDGVDISVLSGLFVAHAAGSAYGQHAGGVGSHMHQSAGAEGGTLDHGLALTGLGDDDHTQYLKEKGSGGTAAETPGHTHQSAAQCGTLDHGLALTGLGDDDHTIYAVTPGTLDVATANNRNDAGAHYHAVTSSANPGAAAALLASAPVTGLVQLTGLGLGRAGAAGNLSVLGVSTQLYLYYDATHLADFYVNPAGTLTIGATLGLALAPTGDITLDPVGNDVLPGTGYDINLGMLTRKYLTLHCAELWVETLVAQNTLATIGGRILVGPTTTLTVDLGGADLVLNGGFETAGGGGADVWSDWTETAGTGAIADEVVIVFEGAHAAKLTAGATESTYITQDMVCLAATRYDLTIHHRNATAGSPGRYSVYDVTHSAYIVLKAALPESTTAWARKDYFFTTPAGCVALRIILYAAATNTRVVYFDSVSLLPGEISAKHNQMASGDTAYLEANGGVEFLGISSAPGGAGPYTYDVARNLDRTGANAWAAGDAVFNTGATGDGFIDLYSIAAVSGPTKYGPTIVGNVRNSATFNDWTEHWAIGNLNGLYGYAADTYGVGLGRYSTTTSYLTADATNGIRMLRGATQLANWDIAGNILIGQAAAGQDNVYISAGAIAIRNNVTERIGLTAAGILTIKDSGGAAVFTFDAAAGAEFTKPLTLATTGGIYQGTGTFAAPTTGLKLWNDGGIGRIAGYNAGVLQWYANTDGKLYAGAGDFFVDSAGVAVKVGSAYSQRASYQFLNSAGVLVSDLSAYLDTTAHWNMLYLFTESYLATDSGILIQAKAPSGRAAQVVIRPYIGATGYDYLFDKDKFLSYQDIWSNGDARIGAGLYVGSVATDPPPGAIQATDYVGAGGGVHVGETTDPGDDVLAISTYCIRKVVSKSGIPDNVATAIFTVTTTNEAGNTDGGGYVCFIRTYVGHGTGSATAAIAAKIAEARFSRVVPATGTGTATSLSAVTEVADDNLAATVAATRSIGDIVPTVAATSNYIATFSLQIDTTGSSATTAEVVVEIEVIWYGFLTAPVIAVA